MILLSEIFRLPEKTLGRSHAKNGFLRFWNYMIPGSIKAKIIFVRFWRLYHRFTTKVVILRMEILSHTVKNLINKKSLKFIFRHVIMPFYVSDHISFVVVPNLPLSHTKAVCSSSSSESIIILASFLDYFFVRKNVSEELGPFTDVIKDQGSVVLSL